MADTDPSDHRGKDASSESEEERLRREEREKTFRRIGDSLISSIWGDSSAALKRGQGVVAGVAQGTKDELVRMISQEVRGFLDKMDAADLVQEIVSGLVIEMKTEIRFKRDESGRVEPEIRNTDTRVGSDDAAPDADADADADASAARANETKSSKSSKSSKPSAPDPAKGETKPKRAEGKLKKGSGKLNELLERKLGSKSKSSDDG